MTAIRQLCAHEGCDNTIEARVGPGLCEQHAVQEQVEEDTCEAHGRFCCGECFDMTPIATVTVQPSTLYAPAMLRALCWVSERHRDSGVQVTHFRDEADVGWFLIRPQGANQHYIASPTGRVWRAQAPWSGEGQYERIEPPIRDADYA